MMEKMIKICNIVYFINVGLIILALVSMIIEPNILQVRTIIFSLIGCCLCKKLTKDTHEGDKNEKC